MECGESQSFYVILGYVPSLKLAQAVGEPVYKIKGCGEAEWDRRGEFQENRKESGQQWEPAARKQCWLMVQGDAGERAWLDLR